MELNAQKDPGPMEISAAFLQYNIEKITPVLRNCINSVFITGRIPDEWKNCYVIPKKGSLIEIENHRGIAIQSCLPKLLDRIITRMLYETLEPIISEQQHGFLKGRSTVTNLMEITQLIHSNLKKSQIDVIYFDFSKAFDQIRHDYLAIKLCKLSVRFNFFKIIMEFIIGRSYILKIDGEPTEFVISPKRSVPQGSHSGPIL